MRLYYAINEELKPAVRAVSLGISLQAVLAPALPPVPTIAELLLVRPRLPPAVTVTVCVAGGGRPSAGPQSVLLPCAGRHQAASYAGARAAACVPRLLPRLLHRLTQHTWL